MNQPIYLSYFPYRLQFKYPFRIAHTERTGTDNVYVLLRQGEFTAWGECVFIPYYSETLETFKTLISNTPLPTNTEDIGAYSSYLKNLFPDSYFCIGALDIALHNLRTATTGLSITAQYNLPENTKGTSFTFGIADDAELERKFNDNPSMEYYKLKVNEQEVNRIISTYKRLTDKPYTIDANQGFSDRNEVLKLTYRLADEGVAYIEQPFHKEDLESHAWLKSRSPIPVIADESFQNFQDLEKVVNYFDGINLKVMKCGGISEGVACLKRAQEMELKSIIGCMSESSVVNDASKQIAGLADWVDLDGPLLLTNDLFATPKPTEELVGMLMGR
jgi:L-alanine-DL-glutamate epimerase-like enolase superfamily enzyme